MNTHRSNNARSALTRGLRRALGVLAAATAAFLALGPVATLVGLGQALADEYEPVTGAVAQTRTDPNPFLIAAYGFIWVAVLVYVIGVARGLGRARAEVAELRRRIDAATAGRT